jgi:DNA polymerase III psi subunit
MSREFYAQFSTHLNQLLDQLAELDYPYSPKGLMLSTQIADALALIQQSDSPELTSLYNNTIQKLRKNVFQNITPSDMQSYIQEDLSGSDATSASSIIGRLYDFQPKQMSQQLVTDDKSSNVISPPPPQTEIDRLRRIQGLPPLPESEAPTSSVESNVTEGDEISASQKRAASQAAAKLKQAFGVDRSTIINSSPEQLKQMAAEYGGQSWLDTWTKNNVMKYFNIVIKGSPKNAEIVPPTPDDTTLGRQVQQMSNESSAMQSRGAPVIVRGGDSMMKGGDVIKGGDTTIINNTVIESENFRHHVAT